MIKKSEKRQAVIASQTGAKKEWANPSFQKIEVSARISAAALLKLDPAGPIGS
ncbi:hypothetical protein [Emticicia sp. TH156]|uniref:hypothetical protein n=1 Tax=Emticicia sp. TH156 TaxID=2067454 RepID=UPI0013040ACC|nr:hypothetical protein [Emticicia sp. TH156]